MLKSCKVIVIISILGIFIFGCKKETAQIQEEEEIKEVILPLIKKDTPLFEIILEKDISIDEYFDFVHQLVEQYDSLVPYELTEYLLVHANDWIIDTFAHSDYYFQKEKGNFIYNQKEFIILQRSETLFLPNEKIAKEIQKKIEAFSIDINIPEYKLRVFQNDSIIFTYPIRVGRVGERYMSTVEREVDMKTRTGEGKIVKINRNPRWQNPVDGHEYKTTLRDDLKRTKVPRIPFLNPEINGKRWGQLIHPTTNPETLGKAYSNGCIGTSEGDAWRIYFYAPIGTKVKIRYDLEVEENGKKHQLKDIYHYGKK